MKSVFVGLALQLKYQQPFTRITGCIFNGIPMTILTHSKKDLSIWLTSTRETNRLNLVSSARMSPIVWLVNYKHKTLKDTTQQYAMKEVSEQCYF